MAKIRIKGDTSGYIDIAAPDVAGATTLNLPTSGAELLSSASVLDSDQIGIGAVSVGKMASTLDLSSKTITVPTDYTTFGTLYNFSGTITFTNSSATGRMGPTLAQCRSAYSSEPNQADWRNNTSLFFVDQGIQYWVVPKDGNYEIETAGAGRNGLYDGRGAIVKSTHTLKAGELLRIIVGQQGLRHSTDVSNYGGHGASAVSVYRRIGNYWLHIPLSIGGGGAGYGGNSPAATSATRDGQYTNSGVPEGGFGSVWTLTYDANSGLLNYWPGGGGGGWARKGATGGLGGATAKKDNAGDALSASAVGGFNEGAGHGGFGGGGATGRDGGAEGGGGGYNGGHAMGYSGNQAADVATGGGSYTHTADGATQTNVGLRTGQGYVKVTL